MAKDSSKNNESENIPLDAEQLGRLEACIGQAHLSWTLSFVAENQSAKLSSMLSKLQLGVSETGDGKRVADGFEYWGVGPTVAWLATSQSRWYLASQRATETFSERWQAVKLALPGQPYHYVSLGIGTGEKDRHILRTLVSLHPKLFFLPVDMSQEMLREGVKRSTDEEELIPRRQRYRIVPVQLDISVSDNIETFRSMLDCLLQSEPILFSLLGNTLANFEDDSTLLRTISGLLKPQDRLLVEVARTTEMTENAAAQAQAEYASIPGFKSFAISALNQATDLAVNQDCVHFIGATEGDKSIKIKTYYKNETDQHIRILLANGLTTMFPPNDTIRLYLSRKYSKRGVEQVIKASELSIVDRKVTMFADSANIFGMELLLLERSQRSRPRANPRSNKADVLLVTATDVESQAVLSVCREITGHHPSYVHIGNKTYWDFNNVGGARVFLVQSEMGAGGPGGSSLTAFEGIQVFKPSTVIMVGIAFGTDPEKQQIGDILVSQRLQYYDLEKVGTGPEGQVTIIPRGNRVEASTRALSRFRAASLDWQDRRPQFGLILSGAKLVDNVDFRDQLISRAPEAIGGEMEGAGIVDAATNQNVDWILIKAICDWADGRKSENKSERQQIAATNAGRFVIHVLRGGGFTITSAS